MSSPRTASDMTERYVFVNCLATKCGRGDVWHPPANLFCFEFFFEPVGKLLLIQQIIENFQVAVQKEIFPKNTFFSYHHLLWGLQLRPPMHENFVPGMVFGSRRDLL